MLRAHTTLWSQRHGSAVAGVAEGFELGVPGPAEQVVDGLGEVAHAERGGDEGLLEPVLADQDVAVASR